MIDWNAVKEYAEVVIIALIMALIIRTFVVQAFKIPSGSMLETLQIGDHILVNKFKYRFTRVKRGDIIVFEYPVNPKIDFIKRVIGLPGDVVRVIEKKVYLNGQPLDEPYAIFRDAKGGTNEGDNFGPLTVPDDSYFVMGDNRDESYDSRFWGVLSGEAVKGNAFFIYWPISRFGRIDH